MTSYLIDLYRQCGDEGYLAVFSKRTRKTEWFQADEKGFERAVALMVERGQFEDMYHSFNLYGAPAASGRGGSDAISFSPGIMFDADLKSSEAGVHAKQDLPESLEEVEDWLEEARIPQPTHVRNSGNGLYLDWYWEEPVFLRTSEARRKYAGSVSDFQRSLIQKGRELRDWNFDFTGDLARITRMPGTFNHKTSCQRRSKTPPLAGVKMYH